MTSCGKESDSPSGPSIDLFEREVTGSAIEYAQAGDAISRIPVKYQRPEIATIELIPHKRG